MNPQEAAPLNNLPDRRLWGVGSEPEYRVTVRLSLHDAEALWRLAAGRLGAAPGANAEMIEETIGSIEAPQIEDCLSLLFAPPAIAGCAIDDYWVEAMPGLSPQAAIASIVR